MSKRQLLCLLGIWVIIFLFLGFPSSWHKIIAVISGVIIVGISYTLPADKKTSETFVENKQQ